MQIKTMLTWILDHRSTNFKLHPYKNSPRNRKFPKFKHKPIAFGCQARPCRSNFFIQNFSSNFIKSTPKFFLIDLCAIDQSRLPAESREFTWLRFAWSGKKWTDPSRSTFVKCKRETFNQKFYVNFSKIEA